MANVLTVNYTQDVLDQMRCSMCKGYLSCSPVRVLPDGSCLCGRCTPSCDVHVHRALAFEMLLNQVSFPCQFKESGCTERAIFDRVADHESKCVYRSISCPSLSSCDWKGSTTKMHNHFSEQHPGLVKETAEFELKINEDAEGIFIMKKDDLLFVIKYLYNVFENCLKYDLRYCMNWRKNEATYKVQLINNADSDCSVSLKTNKCLIFDNTFYDAQNAQILKLTKHLDILDNPTTVRVVIKLMVLEFCGSSTSQEIKLVDYNLLETVSCNKCRNYLIPPLYDARVGTICCNCATFDTTELPLSTNTELINLISQMNYPCRWRGCNFIGNGEDIRLHNLFCEFRLYCCRVSNCGAYISLATAAKHLQGHKNCRYLAADGFYKIVLSKNYSDTTFIWTVKNGILIVIEHSTSYKYDIGEMYVHGQSLRLLSDLIQFTAMVRFEHEHCNIKSKPFVFVSGKPQIIDFAKLPTCFNETEELLLIIVECKLSLN